ncbi:MAG: hypothetical protein WA990_07510 [Rubrobacteraceae bacterium]
MILLMGALVIAGCANRDEVTQISPSPAGQRPADFGLGPGIRPLSSGPGDKGSPGWSPSGRLAFVVDGYVVEKQPGDATVRRQTTRDLGAEKVAWTSSDRLRILVRDPKASGNPSTPEDGPPGSVYGKIPDESLNVNKLADDVSAVAPTTDGGLLVALRTGASKSQLAIVSSEGAIQAFGNVLEGEITALSVVPDGSGATVALRKPGSEGNFEVLSFSFEEGRYETLTNLREGLRILGAPQWTSDGIYYVAGEEPETGDEISIDYNLYRLPPNSGRPALAPGVGEGFVVSGLKRSPDGGLLAVVGRRNASSPVNLYVLRPGIGDIVAVTNNENMEIKTEADNLAWSADGSRVAIVARTMLSVPRVYDVPADALVSDFYNVYEAPVEATVGEGSAG